MLPIAVLALIAATLAVTTGKRNTRKAAEKTPTRVQTTPNQKTEAGGIRKGSARLTPTGTKRGQTDEYSLELARIMELRAIIEPPIAALAAKRLTFRETEQLRALVEEMEQETALEHYAELDRVFYPARSPNTPTILCAQLTEVIARRLCRAGARRCRARSGDRSPSPRTGKS